MEDDLDLDMGAFVVENFMDVVRECLNPNFDRKSIYETLFNAQNTLVGAIHGLPTSVAREVAKHPKTQIALSSSIYQVASLIDKIQWESGNASKEFVLSYCPSGINYYMGDKTAVVERYYFLPKFLSGIDSDLKNLDYDGLKLRFDEQKNSHSKGIVAAMLLARSAHGIEGEFKETLEHISQNGFGVDLRYSARMADFGEEVAFTIECDWCDGSILPPGLVSRKLEEYLQK